jgi:hypothetical protein
LHEEYPALLKHDTLITDLDKLFFKTISNPDLIFWGYDEGTYEMTLHNHIGDDLTGDFQVEDTQWKFLDLQEIDYRLIKRSTMLRGPKPYVAFLSDGQGDYDHVLLEHLGSLAFLRKTEPPNAKFLLVDHNPSRNVLRELLEDLDPHFAYSRVIWIPCGGKIKKRHHRVQMRGGTTFKIMMPQSSAKHEALLQMAREWVHQIMPMEDLTPRGTVMFYQGKRGEVQIEGRQEKQMIGKIQHMMTRYNRPETLVVWDPNVEEKHF